MTHPTAKRKNRRENSVATVLKLITRHDDLISPEDAAEDAAARIVAAGTARRRQELKNTHLA